MAAKAGNVSGWVQQHQLKAQIRLLTAKKNRMRWQMQSTSTRAKAGAVPSPLSNARKRHLISPQHPTSSSTAGIALHFGIRLLFQSLDLWDLLLIYSVNEFSND